MLRCTSMTEWRAVLVNLQHCSQHVTDSQNPASTELMFCACVGITCVVCIHASNKYDFHPSRCYCDCLQCFDTVCTRKRIQLVKNWVVGCCHGYLGWGADLHMAQQMPLPLTVSCSSKYWLVLPSWFLPCWYLLTRVVPDIFQKSSKTIVCVHLVLH